MPQHRTTTTKPFLEKEKVGPASEPRDLILVPLFSYHMSTRVFRWSKNKQG
jgi:hypothetical protein